MLRRSPLVPPQYWAKTIVNVANDSKFSVNNYRIPNSLDIVPLQDIKKIKINDSLSIQVSFNNKPIKTTLRIKNTNGENFFMQTKKQSGITSFKIKKYGLYLITTSHDGTGSSLTFQLAPPKESKK